MDSFFEIDVNNPNWAQISDCKSEGIDKFYIPNFKETHELISRLTINSLDSCQLGVKDTVYFLGIKEENEIIGFKEYCFILFYGRVSCYYGRIQFYRYDPPDF